MILEVYDLNLILVVHKLSLLVTLLFGLIAFFMKNERMKKIHYFASIALVMSIFIYLLQISFANIRYVIYGFFLLLAFITPKFIKGKGKLKLISHLSLVMLSIVCLVVVHII